MIDVAYEVANKSDKPVAPHAYFQFLRDGNAPSEQAAQTSAFAGVTTFTGPAVYTDEAKFHEGRLQGHREGQAVPPEEGEGRLDRR